MAVTIRGASAGDREACIELLQDLSAVTGEWVSPAVGDAFDALLDGGRGRILVAEDDGELLGLAAVSYGVAMRLGGEYGQLEELVVDPSARGKQVGRRLMEAAVAHARERGCVALEAQLTAVAAGARPFYEKFGFEAAGAAMRRSLS